MPYSQSSKQAGANFMACEVCAESSVFLGTIEYDEVFDCSRCGDYQIPKAVRDDYLPIKDGKSRALVSHFMRKMYDSKPRKRVALRRDLIDEFLKRSLPTPAELMDNALLWVADKANGRPVWVTFRSTDAEVQATIGAIDHTELQWAVDNLKLLGSFEVVFGGGEQGAILTPVGWRRVEELRLAHVASRYAFFARRFKNDALDSVVEACIRPAVAQTDFELRLVTQRAGLIDATIEDEIRRCRFLIADLSDDNAGAYWEAGFAEGLGKPVIYLCSKSDFKEPTAEKKTHFDTDHRHTVRWDPDPATFGETANLLKAVIRNTLLGEARQDD